MITEIAGSLLLIIINGIFVMSEIALALLNDKPACSSRPAKEMKEPARLWSLQALQTGSYQLLRSA